MRIELYSISWNERRMLPFFLDYYGPWVDRLVIFDDQSDDGTAENLKRHPKVDLRPLPPKGSSFVLTALEIWQHAWKESRTRADWVIVTNIDEFIYHPGGMRGYLERCTEQGVTMVHPRGYEMVGERFPDPGQSLVETVRKGVAMFGQDKRQVFNPDAVAEMNYGPGRHECRPTGRVVEPSVSRPRCCITSMWTRMPTCCGASARLRAACSKATGDPASESSITWLPRRSSARSNG
jgi:hypothetical protein